MLLVCFQLAAPVHGCREKTNCNRGDPLSHVSVDSLVHIKRPRLYHSKHIGTKCPNASAHTPDTSSQQISASNQYCDSHDLVKGDLNFCEWDCLFLSDLLY